MKVQKRKRAMTKGHVTLMGPVFNAWLARTRSTHKAKALAKANACKHLQRLAVVPHSMYCCCGFLAKGGLGLFC